MRRWGLGARILALMMLVGTWDHEARADAIIITRAMTASTIAEVFIGNDLIRVELEIGGPDLPAFRNLMPDGVYERLGFEPEPMAERVKRFFAEDLVFSASGGPALPGRIVELEPRPRVRRDELTGQPLPASEDEPEMVVFAVLEYALTGRPDSLTVTAPSDERGLAAANIGFVAYHRGLPANDFRYLSAEQTLDLNWEDPWYSRFRNRNLRRQYDAPMNVFLYVEPYEVRAEIIARPKDLEQWVDLGLGDRETIPVEMQPEIKRRAAEFLAGYSKVTIDGELREPTLDRVNFLRRTLRSSTVVDPPEELDAISATLGVIFVYPVVGLPQEALLTWDLFSDRIQKVPAAATDEAGPLRFFLVPDDNVLWWKNFLKNPTMPTLMEVTPPPGVVTRAFGWAVWILGLAGLGLAAVQAVGAAKGRALPLRPAVAAIVLLLAAGGAWAASRESRMTDERSGEVVEALLHNIYRAFDFREESDIYDMLAQSVTGNLLTQTYLETRRGLELASQGGARAKVKEIEMLRVEPESLRGEPGFRARCVWIVSGAVGHWGHIHQRKNRYEAELKVQPVDGAWKVTELQLLQEERL